MITDQTITHFAGQAQGAKVLVLGDLILDRYEVGQVERVSPEAPVLVLRTGPADVRLGGASSVALLLRTLGAQVSLCGTVGDDENGRTLVNLAAEAGIRGTHILEDAARPTTTKTRYVGQLAGQPHHPLLRVDRELCDHATRTMESRLVSAVQRTADHYQAIVVSDYGKGVCTPRVLTAVWTAAKRANLPTLVDPSRNRDYADYRGARIIIPNRGEAQQVSRCQISCPAEALSVGRWLCDCYGFDAAIVKLDAAGMAVVDPNAGLIHHIPATVRSVGDVTGAGDTVLAAMGLGYAIGGDVLEVAQLANVAAGLQVERTGVCPISWSDIRADLAGDASRHKIVTLDTLSALISRYRAEGRKIVVTNGCFDLLHAGHVACLQEAAGMGDVLIVALNGDQSVRRQKGCERPILCQSHRAAVLAAMGCVDHVVIFNEDTPHAVLCRIRPDVLVKGGTYTLGEVQGSEIVTAYGGVVRLTSAVGNLSTSRIISAVRHQTEPVVTAPENS